MFLKTIQKVAVSVIKVSLAVLIFFAVLWVTLGFDKAVWTVGVLLENWFAAIKQMNFLVIVFALVVGMIGLMWALNAKLKQQGGESEHEKLYQYLALSIFAAISGILVAVVLI